MPRLQYYGVQIKLHAYGITYANPYYLTDCKPMVSGLQAYGVQIASLWHSICKPMSSYTVSKLQAYSVQINLQTYVIPYANPCYLTWYVISYVNPCYLTWCQDCKPHYNMVSRFNWKPMAFCMWTHVILHGVQIASLQLLVSSLNCKPKAYGISYANPFYLTWCPDCMPMVSRCKPISFDMQTHVILYI